MKKILKSVAIAAVVFGGPVPSVSSQGIPVFDASSLAQLVAQLNNQAQQITNQVSQITELQNQLQNMQQRLTAMTGPKGLSTLLNSTLNQTQREAASSLQSIVDGAISGSSIGGNSSRITSKINELKTKFSLDNLAELDGSTIPQDRAIAAVAAAGLTAVATGEDGYTRSNEGMTRVNSLIGQIDATPDLKASVDLNTRVMAEVAQQMNEMMRVMSAQTSAQGTAAVDNARDRAAARKFLKIGE